MFTGIIQTRGVIKNTASSAEGAKLTVHPDKPFADLKHGESIAVNGVCLTVEHFSSNGDISFHTLAETLRRTNLGSIGKGGIVNLERALAVGDRMGGHIVSGHIDTVVKLLEKRKPATASGDWEFVLELPSEYASLVVEKGSVALDGISLTVARTGDGCFSVCLIPVTLADTALMERMAGDGINFEADIVGKYVQRILGRRVDDGGKSESRITMQTLLEAGF